MTPEQNLQHEIEATDGWRGTVYQQLANLVKTTAPELKLNWKWNSAVWSGKKDVLSVSPFKQHVKIMFFKGAHLVEFQDEFNNGLDSKNMRSIDFFDPEEFDPQKVATVIRAAVALDAQ